MNDCLVHCCAFLDAFGVRLVGRGFKPRPWAKPTRGFHLRSRQTRFRNIDGGAPHLLHEKK